MATYSFHNDFRSPVLQFDRESKLFILVEDYYFQWVHGGIHKRIYIPRGFTFDKASVPKPLWGLARPDGPVEAAALVHDYTWLYKGRMPMGFYSVLLNGSWEYDSSPWTKAQTNNLFEKMLVYGGLKPWQARVYRGAVEVWPPNWFKGF